VSVSQTVSCKLGYLATITLKIMPAKITKGYTHYQLESSLLQTGQPRHFKNSHSTQAVNKILEYCVADTSQGGSF